MHFPKNRDKMQVFLIFLMSTNIENLYIFDGFSKEIVAYFLLMTQAQFRKKGDIILKQGDVSNGCAYYINSGKVRVIIDGEERATIGQGGFFGEMALITDDLRTATIEVVEDAELQVFLKEDFLMLLMKSEHGEQLNTEIRRRITENMKNNPNIHARK